MNIIHRFVLVVVIMFVLMVACGPRPAKAIFNCASPEEVYQAGVERGWTYVRDVPIFFWYVLIQEWTKGELLHHVFFVHPANGRKDMVCYSHEGPPFDWQPAKGAVDEGDS